MIPTNLRRFEKAFNDVYSVSMLQHAKNTSADRDSKERPRVGTRTNKAS